MFLQFWGKLIMNNHALKGDWLVNDLKKNNSWLFELDPQDKKEIIEATKNSVSSSKKLYNITKSDSFTADGISLEIFLHKLSFLIVSTTPFALSYTVTDLLI